MLFGVSDDTEPRLSFTVGESRVLRDRQRKPSRSQTKSGTFACCASISSSTRRSRRSRGRAREPLARLQGCSEAWWEATDGAWEGLVLSAKKKVFVSQGKRENVKTSRSPRRHVHAYTCLACRVAFVVMPRIAWVRRQRAGANPGGPPLLDLWLLCWSVATGVVVRCFIGSLEVFFLVKSSRASSAH